MMLTTTATTAAMSRASRTRRTSRSESAVASDRRWTRTMPPASVGRPSTRTGVPPTTSLSEIASPASRAARRAGVRASRARGLVDATAPARPTLADSMPSVPSVRTARFCDTRAAAPESARSAAASAIAARVLRAESSADVRVRLTASSPASSAVSTATPTASRTIRRESVPRPPVTVAAGRHRQHARPSGRCGSGSRRRASRGPGPRGRRRCARRPSRGIPPDVAEQLLAGEDDARSAQEVTGRRTPLRSGRCSGRRLGPRGSSGRR